MHLCLDAKDLVDLQRQPVPAEEESHELAVKVGGARTDIGNFTTTFNPALTRAPAGLTFKTQGNLTAQALQLTGSQRRSLRAPVF